MYYVVAPTMKLLPTLITEWAVPRSVSTSCEPRNLTGNVLPSAVADATVPSDAEVSVDWLNGLMRLWHTTAHGTEV